MRRLVVSARAGVRVVFYLAAMGTDVRVAPERVAAVSVGVLWGRPHREPQPELLPVTEIGVAIVDAGGADPVVESRCLLKDADINLATEHLLDLDLPVVGFNLLRFDWVALQSRCDVSPLIERTIDVYSSLYGLVREIVDAEGVSAFPVSGDFGVLNPRRLAELNLGFVPGRDDDAVGDAELAAALWHRFVSSERALIAGHSHMLEDEQLDLLCGARPAFASADEWRAEVSKRPEPKPYRKRQRHQVTFPRIDQRYV
jgi:hypothetical protein